MRIPFRAIIALLFVLCHLRGIDAPPNGFHKWRETDTATVAENYATESMDFFAPRVNVRGTGDGIVGMELPVYNYATAILYRAFGFSHLWPRLLSLISGLFLLFGVYEMARKLTGNLVTARVAMFLAAFSPLISFYSIKIQPDVLGMALTVWGFVQFLEWTDSHSGRRLFATAALLALAGCIKPTFLFVGLPMAWILWTERGSDFVREPAVWVLAGLVLAPVASWLSFARGLTERFGSAYFYLGGNPLEELSGLLSPKFYQNTLLTWPWEMALGIPGVLILALGLRKRIPGGAVMAAWMIGAFVVFVLAAGHCATPHDYYYLPAAPALVFVAAVVASNLLVHPERWRRVATVTLLVAAPFYGQLRIAQRFDLKADFAATREMARTRVEPGALVLAVDGIPGDILYQTGLKGYWAKPPVSDKDLVKWARMGARYVLTPAGRGVRIQTLDAEPMRISMP